MKIRAEHWKNFADARASTELVLCEVRGRFGAQEERAAYQRWREMVFQRAGYRCQTCGREPPRKMLDAHFLQPYIWVEGAEIDPNIGIAVCRSHHRQIHQASVEGRIGRQRLT